MGATLGVTIMGAIVNHGLPPGVSAGGEGIGDPPAAARGTRRPRDALQPAFLAASIVSFAVWVIAVIWVKEQPLRRSLDEISRRRGRRGRAARRRPQ